VLDLFVEFDAFVAHGIPAFARIQQSRRSALSSTRELVDSSLFCPELAKVPESFDWGAAPLFEDWLAATQAQLTTGVLVTEVPRTFLFNWLRRTETGFPESSA
jgi:hypothetical protein